MSIQRDQLLVRPVIPKCDHGVLHRQSHPRVDQKPRPSSYPVRTEAGVFPFASGVAVVSSDRLLIRRLCGTMITIPFPSSRLGCWCVESSRYDQVASSYLAMVTIACILEWL